MVTERGGAVPGTGVLGAGLRGVLAVAPELVLGAVPEGVPAVVPEVVPVVGSGGKLILLPTPSPVFLALPNVCAPQTFGIAPSSSHAVSMLTAVTARAAKVAKVAKVESIAIAVLLVLVTPTGFTVHASSEDNPPVYNVTSSLMIRRGPAYRITHSAQEGESVAGPTRSLFCGAGAWRAGRGRRWCASASASTSTRSCTGHATRGST